MQVQVYVFGKPLTGSKDVLTGFRKMNEAVYDRYSLVTQTNQPEHEVEGVAYQVSEMDLKKADIYETSAYKREKFQLKSGKWAWVYVENSN